MHGDGLAPADSPTASEVSAPRALRRHAFDTARALALVARNRNLRNAQLSWAAAWTGEWAFTTALAVYAFQQGGATAVGLVGVVRMLPAALMVPFATALADRMRRERILVGCGVLRAATTATAGAVAIADASAFGVYALAVVATMAFGPYLPAHGALMPSLCHTPRELTSANAARSLLDGLSVLLGPLLAAALLSATGVGVAFVAAAAASALSAALIAALRYDAPPATEARRPALIGQMIDGFRVMAANHEVGLLIGLVTAQTFVRGALNVLLVVIALDLLALGEPGVGLLTAAMGAGGLLGALGASLLAGGRRLAAWYGVGVALWSLPLAVVGAWPEAGTAVAMLALIGAANALVDVTIFTLLPRTVDDEVLARVFGTLQTMVYVLSAAGAAVAPALVGLLGARGAMVAVGLLLPPLVGLSWARLAAIDRRISVRDREIALLQRVPMLRPLPVPTIEHLAARLEKVTVPAGRPVFTQGDPGDRFYVIATGEAGVVGDGQPIRTLGAGDGFGEIALLHDVPRTATVSARTDLEVYTLGRDAFLPAVSGYRESAAEADATVGALLAAFRPRAMAG